MVESVSTFGRKVCNILLIDYIIRYTLYNINKHTYNRLFNNNSKTMFNQTS